MRYFHAIRTLIVQWGYQPASTIWFDFFNGYGANSLTFWRSTCNAIAEMQGLRDVRLDICTFIEVKPMHEEAFFTCIERMSRIGRRVRVQTNWNNNEILAREGRQWGFELVRGVL